MFNTIDLDFIARIFLCANVTPEQVHACLAQHADQKQPVMNVWF